MSEQIVPQEVRRELRPLADVLRRMGPEKKLVLYGFAMGLTPPTAPDAHTDNAAPPS